MEIGERFARALVAKDADGVMSVLADRVDFRALTPNRAWEAADAGTVTEIVFGSWFEPKDELRELVAVESGRMADRQTVTYRLRGENPDGPFIVEQTAYLTETGGRIDWLRMLCSGFRPG
jgi:hypothetical protein